MRPAYQQVLHGDGTVGDCFRACLASILEVDTNQVPHFVEMYRERWADECRMWLKDNHNLGMTTIHLHGLDDYIVFQATGGTECIASIPSPNFPGLTHAVVAEVASAGLSLRFKFDPNPKGKPCADEGGYFLDEFQP